MSDSFADLWNASAPLPAKPKPQTLTLAARLAQENDKRNRASTPAVSVQSHKAPDVSDAAWVGLDSLESGGKVKVDDVDDWGFGVNSVNRTMIVAGHDEDEEDILGVLSKPVDVVIAKKNLELGSSRTSTPLSRPRSPASGQASQARATPPPPHHSSGKVDDLDDWGFGSTAVNPLNPTTIAGHDEDEEDILGVLSKPVDVVIAKKNLDLGSSRTPTPLSRPRSPPSGQAPQARATPPPPPPPPPRHSNVREPPRGQKERERERKERESQRTRRQNNSSIIGAGPTTAADIQEQADKLILQASEIGLNMLSRASAFWKEGKEKVVKVMEERGGGVGASSGSGGGFEERGRGKVDSFYSDSIPSRSVSPPPPPQHTSQPHTRTHSSPPRPQRTLLTTSSSTLSLVFTHKNTGTSQFKLGQYGLASESYTSAITLLPPGHLLLVPLYTNRSLARLKCGEYVGAGEDAGEALNIICVVDSNIDLSSRNGNGNVLWNPDTELPELIQGGRDKVNQGGWLDPGGVGVDLVDGYVKALRRRAEAWEGREKWEEAGRDWEILAGGGGGVGRGWIGEGIRTEAVRGAGRCRKMVSASGQEGVGFSSSSSLASKPPLSKQKTKPSQSLPSSSQPSKALLAHQATTLQAEADDTLKHQLKDSVDTRISAWKNGKETNIRALLASLDMVLWREILSGGVKVNGLGELVTDVQVKKGYMKAIAKVHPDKFNTSNSTVEQRMLANSVFAALNEAWIAFQGGK